MYFKPKVDSRQFIISKHLVGQYKGETKLLGCFGKILGITGEVANELVTIECSTFIRCCSNCVSNRVQA